ncbi:MAG TPA: hypothetical protein VGL23_23130 [Chloroflexota bacterium]|jgi:hypothetical protein
MSNRWSPRGRLAIALVLAIGLLSATVAETFAAPKLNCADATWDCTLSGPGKHTR